MRLTRRTASVRGCSCRWRTWWWRGGGGRPGTSTSWWTTAGPVTPGLTRVTSLRTLTGFPQAMIIQYRMEKFKCNTSTKARQARASKAKWWKFELCFTGTTSKRQVVKFYSTRWVASLTSSIKIIALRYQVSGGLLSQAGSQVWYLRWLWY